MANLSCYNILGHYEDDRFTTVELCKVVMVVFRALPVPTIFAALTSFEGHCGIKLMGLIKKRDIIEKKKTNQ